MGQHYFGRVGWTLDDSKGLGEDNHSFGFGSTGKKVFNNEFECYAESYGPGDVIGCFLVSKHMPASLHVYVLLHIINLGP